MSPPLPRKPFTIIDVASAAGVSVSTVSRVINNKEDVSEETSRRVRQVIDDLGYSSSLAAKGMRSKATGLIGLIMPDIQDPFSVQLMKGINRGILEFGRDLIIYTSGDFHSDEISAREQQYISLLNNGLTDGVVIVTPQSGGYSSISPVVSVDPNVLDPQAPAVISTNYQGAMEATRHLISLGHQRIGFIEGRPELQSANRRKEGYIAALKEVGISINPQLIIQGDFTFETAYSHSHELFELSEPPTAIFASNDQSALGVRRAALDRKLRVPQDISLVGFDNTFFSQDLELTTVDQAIEEMGFMAVKILADLIEGRETVDLPYKVQTRLVVRNSTMPIN